MAFKQQPLQQSEYAMTIIKDLGRTTATVHTTALARYAILNVQSAMLISKHDVEAKQLKLNSHV